MRDSGHWGFARWCIEGGGVYLAKGRKASTATPYPHRVTQWDPVFGLNLALDSSQLRVTIPTTPCQAPDITTMARQNPLEASLD